MSNPPNNEHRKLYAGEQVETADCVVLADGLRVFTNNLDRGVVDLRRAEYEWNSAENRYALWFDVRVDTTYDGKSVDREVQQSDDRVATRFEGRAA